MRSVDPARWLGAVLWAGSVVQVADKSKIKLEEREPGHGCEVVTKRWRHAKDVCLRCCRLLRPCRAEWRYLVKRHGATAARVMTHCLRCAPHLPLVLSACSLPSRLTTDKFGSLVVYCTTIIHGGLGVESSAPVHGEGVHPRNVGAAGRGLGSAGLGADLGPALSLKLARHRKRLATRYKGLTSRLSVIPGLLERSVRLSFSLALLVLSSIVTQCTRIY